MFVEKDKKKQKRCRLLNIFYKIHGKQVVDSKKTLESVGACNFDTKMWVVVVIQWVQWLLPASVTRLGDLLDYGQLFEAFGYN